MTITDSAYGQSIAIVTNTYNENLIMVTGMSHGSGTAHTQLNY